ncbi:hypothetical protein BJF90_29740 [Pseudonocardia sp. CNS-004]|nr:hypothetical protein BJF90_29740 [Pseudonocardia sp. CNS-004]
MLRPAEMCPTCESPTGMPGRARSALPIAIMGGHSTRREGPRMGRPREREAGGLLLHVIRSRPLTSFFVMTFALSWAWFGLALGVWGCRCRDRPASSARSSARALRASR